MSVSAASVLANVFLFMLIGGMAGTIDVHGFRSKLKNYRGIGTGVACQFFLLPVLGFASVMIFGLDRVYGIMLLIVTTSPGGGFSGWWCSLCNADLALSVAMTTVSTLISIAMLPLNILIYVQAIYGVSVQLDWVGIMTSVSVVIGAVVVGLVFGTKRPDLKNYFNKLGTFGGIANICVGIFTASTGGGSGSTTDPFSLAPTWYVAIAAPCISGLFLAFGIAKLLRCSGPEAVSICIECCYQNTGLAITIAVSVFDAQDAARATLVPLFYGAIEIGLIALFALIAWQAGWTYASRSDNFFKCIGGNYQPRSAGTEGAQPQALADAPASTQMVHDAQPAEIDPVGRPDADTQAFLANKEKSLQAGIEQWDHDFKRRTGTEPTEEDRLADRGVQELHAQLTEVRLLLAEHGGGHDGADTTPAATPKHVAVIVDS